MEKNKIYHSTESMKGNVGSIITRSILILLLGLYTVAHILFVPMEVIMVFLFTDKQLTSHLPFVVTLCVVKYILVVELFIVGFMKRTNIEANGVTHLFMIVSCAVVFSGLSWCFYIIGSQVIAAQAFGVVPLEDTPYLHDFLGCLICAIAGVVHVCFMSSNKKYIGYTPIYPN